jgi:predicted ATPase
MTARQPSFDTAPRCTPRRHLTVLEGMPGAGKTSLSHALAASGACVLGEYISGHGTTVAISAHPAVGDDDGHQANWLYKAALADGALRHGTQVYADRDWLSSLAYAYSIADRDGGTLLRDRARWAITCLDSGMLLLPGTYMIFDLDVVTSLRRRAGRLRHGHPWSEPRPLGRLQRFYTDPAQQIAPACPALGAWLRQSRWAKISGLAAPHLVLRQVIDVAGTG